MAFTVLPAIASDIVGDAFSGSTLAVSLESQTGWLRQKGYLGISMTSWAKLLVDSVTSFVSP